MQNNQPSQILNNYFLTQFELRNRSFSNYIVFQPGTRGFFAEITTVVRVAIYAHQHNLQMVLKNDQFGYKYRRGWLDYFLPFCKEYEDEMEPNVIQFCSGMIPQVFMKEMIAHRPEKLSIGPITIHGFNEIMSFFMKMICRPNSAILKELKSIEEEIRLPNTFAAIHIRRGDKVGWEDQAYPIDIYLEHLQKAKGLKMPLFVMSDDYRAIEELKKALLQREYKHELFTLCKEDQKGFDVWDFRKRKNAYNHAETSESQEIKNYNEYVFLQVKQLLIETLLSTKSTVFIGTFRSNVSSSIWLLHPNPKTGIRLRNRDLRKDSK